MCQMTKNLIKAIKTYALEFADPNDESTFFTLKSGDKSPYYLDCRKMIHSHGLFDIVKALDQIIFKEQFDAIGGPCVGVDYLVGAYLHHFRFFGKHFTIEKDPKKRGFGVRKEEKGHGKKGLVFGSVLPSDKVIVVEDVTTTGFSLLHAIETIQEYGCTVVQAMTIVDRKMGAEELFALKGVKFVPLVSIDDLEIEEELKKRGLK